jgi:mannan endo-1,4-beta-mannosidase
MRFSENTICLWLAMILASGCRTPQAPANPKSNARAKAILRCVQSLEGRTNKCVLSGQFSNFGNGANLSVMDKIHDQTGHWPAIFGVDYADFSTDGLTHDTPNQAVIGYWKQGGLVTISAHLYNPARTNASGGLRDKDVDFNTLLDPSSETHVRWLHELDQMADGLQQLKDAGVVVLWRPFHEMNGNWFWWGGKDPAMFIKLWRQMFDYFTKTKGLDNLLWVYSPGSGGKTAAYYPGDRHVDLIGLDTYTDFVDTKHIKGYAEMAQIKKPFGFTEFGPHGASDPPGNYDYLRFIQGVQKDFPRTVFFMSWNKNWSLARNTNTTELLNHPWIVNREDLPRGLVGNP